MSVCRRFAAATLAVAAIGCVAAGPAAAADDNPWYPQTYENVWTDGTSAGLKVTQWYHQDYPGWVFVQAKATKAAILPQDGNGGTTINLGPKFDPVVLCTFGGKHHRADGEGGWWVRKGQRISCEGSVPGSDETQGRRGITGVQPMLPYRETN